jgi:hypothetical protein
MSHISSPVGALRLAASMQCWLVVLTGVVGAAARWPGMWIRGRLAG